MLIEYPKISVLTPTYNRPDYLKDTIKSVISQCMQCWEMLVINDGGEDVRDIVGEFGDKRIRYFNRDINRGKASCLNFGLKTARGEYIAYIDDDDIWYPNHLDVLSRTLDEHRNIGAVYSDLYAVQFLKDSTNGQRYPMHKFIQVSRDYNRDFMFTSNHTLHVSLMHRKELAIRAGGYDEDVSVLIDWNISRKLSFYTDFKYVPLLTGEYYMPFGKSDRISNLERRDQDKFKHNLRKIRADLPPEPWPMVEKVAVVFPVNEWTDEIKEIISYFTDKLYYPVRLILVNNNPGKSLADCKDFLGIFGELKNLFVYTPLNKLSELDAYRFGCKQTDADYVYLPTLNTDTTYLFRIISAVSYFRKNDCLAAKWDTEQEKGSSFDIFIDREVFLKISNSNGDNDGVIAYNISRGAAVNLRCDYLINQARKLYEEGNYKLALLSAKEAEAIKKGGAGDQFLVDIYSKICFELKRYDEAEEKCSELIKRGYGADNYIRLGKIQQIKGKYKDAVKSYQNGLKEIGFKDEYLESPFFPVILPKGLGTFEAFIGIGECMLETGELADASRMFRRASKLRLNSHLPFLGFSKLFMKTNEFEKAGKAINVASKICTDDPDVNRTMGLFYEKINKADKAYCCYVSAFQADKTDEKTISDIYRAGKTNKMWTDLKEIFEEFLKFRPGSSYALKGLSSIYYELEEFGKAKEMVENGLVFNKDDTELKEMSLRIQKAAGWRDGYIES